jgi:hypothetical protein
MARASRRGRGGGRLPVACMVRLAAVATRRSRPRGCWREFLNRTVLAAEEQMLLLAPEGALAGLPISDLLVNSRARSDSRQGAHQLDGLGALRIQEVAEGAQVSKRINTGVVAVAPAEAQGVVADLLDVAQVGIAAFLELNDAGMALAAGARTVTAQDFVGQFGAVAVGPADFKVSSPVGGFDAGGLGASGPLGWGASSLWTLWRSSPRGLGAGLVIGHKGA